AKRSLPPAHATSAPHELPLRRADLFARFSESVRSADTRETRRLPPLRRLQRSARCFERVAGSDTRAGNRFQSIARRRRTARRHQDLVPAPSATRLQNRVRYAFASLVPVLQSSSPCHHTRADACWRHSVQCAQSDIGQRRTSALSTLWLSVPFCDSYYFCVPLLGLLLYSYRKRRGTSRCP